MALAVLLVLALALLLAGCGDEAERADATAAPPAAVAGATPDRAAPIEATGYEVAIATAAANRNRALESCELRPLEERQACVEVALANWEVERAATEGLRGEQP